MNHSTQSPRIQDRLDSFFWTGNAIRSRNVSSVVLTEVLGIPAPPARLTADWERDILERLGLIPGDVEPLALARTRMRWREYALCLQAVEHWTRAVGLGDVLAASNVALMACRGARYHHDGAQYGGAAFCNLFLSEDKGLDVHFPLAGLCIPLRRGTVLVFDTGQPHAVIARGGTGFHVDDFSSDQDCSQVFLTWELPIENAGVAQALGVAFDTNPASAARLDEEQVWLNGAVFTVCQHTGQPLCVEPTSER